ncbi:hypothetical protein QF001_006276 [Paraburkholderia youngii]
MSRISSVRPRADQPADAENLARAHLERHVAHDLAAREPLHFQQRRADVARAEIDMLAELAADHPGDDLLARQIRHRVDMHEAAVAQHRDPFGHPRQLFEPMRDIDEPDAARLQPPDLLEQQIDLARGQHRGRLVEYQHAAVADQVAGDLDHLLMTDTEFADQRVGIDRVEPDLRHRLARVLPQLAAIDPAEAERARARQPVQEQVLGDRQGRQQIQLLHHHAHAERLGLGAARGRVPRAGELHRARARLDQPADDLRQRALARAVLAGQCQYLACPQRQRYVGEHRFGIGLADAADGQHDRQGVVVGRIHRAPDCMAPLAPS